MEPSGGGIGQPLLWSDRERRLWVIVLFTGCILVYAGRGTLPICIVDISKELHWDKKISGIILSSFYWGYTATQVLGGQLSDKYGGDIILIISGIGWASSVFAISLVARLSNNLVLTANLISGISQGIYFPAIASLISSRVSDDNRSFIYGIIHTGPQIGSVVCGLLGYLFLYYHSWIYMFVCIGMLGLLWSVVLKCLSKKYQRKLQYQLLDNSSGTALDDKSIKVNLQKKEITCIEVPWRTLLVQRPILAMLYAAFCEGLAIHSFMSWLPTFFHETFPEQNIYAWKYNMLPWVAKGLSTIAGGWLSNNLLKQGLSRTIVRKLMEGISLFGISICLLILLLFGTTSNFNLALALMVVAFFCSGFEISGCSINSIELAPSYSGFLFGVLNCTSAIPGIFGVSLIGHILHSTGSWNIVFLLIASICFSGFVVYSIFGSGKQLTHI